MKTRAMAMALVLCMVLSLVPGVSAAAPMAMPQPDTAPAALPQSLVQPADGKYTITMNYSGPGKAELYASSAGAQEVVYFLADPEPGYRMDYSKSRFYYKEYKLSWAYIGNNLYAITMPDGDVMLDLQFVPIESDSHDVTLTVSGKGTAAVNQNTAKKGECIFLTIESAPGYAKGDVQARTAGGTEIDCYYLKSVDGSDLYELAMPDEDLEILVDFRRNGPYTITTYIDSDPAGGTVELSHETAYELETVTVTTLPDLGYQVRSVSCYHSVPVREAENTWTFTMPRFREEIHVVFEAIRYPAVVEVEKPVRGTAVLDTEDAVYGQEVVLTCYPQEGYRVARILGIEELTDIGGNAYTFSMPAQPVELTVLFLRENNPFLDVREGKFYHDSVLWAVENGITSGKTADTFAPNEPCTRGQVVTFLWRAMGSPAPTSNEHPFTDVSVGKFYSKAVLWALENGITSGKTADTFAPNEPCTRGQVVTFLWRAMGTPEPTTTEHPFTDVRASKFYAQAVLWALENGITAGVTDTTFQPNGTCTRGQVVTFLYRTDQIPEPEPEPFPDLT